MLKRLFTTLTQDAIAATILSGHRAVRPNADGTVSYADHSTLADLALPVWLTLGAALAGDAVSVRLLGNVTEPSWAWTTGTPIFLGAAGVLTQTPPTTGFLLEVARPITPTKLFWDPKVPIVLT